MNQNSITVYREKVEPNILVRHQKVMAALQLLKEATVYELADLMNTGVHNISGRLTELSAGKGYDRPIIEGCGMRNNKYGNPCTIWRKKEYRAPLEQTTLFNGCVLYYFKKRLRDAKE